MSELGDNDADEPEITKTVMYKLGYAVATFLASPEYRERIGPELDALNSEDIIWVGDRVLARIEEFAIPKIAEAVRYPGLKELNEKLHELGLKKELFVGITQNNGIFEKIGLYTLEEALGDRPRESPEEKP